MANYRSIHVKFWNDGTVEDLSPASKLLMLYFITNPYRNESGLYSITLKRISDDTGLHRRQRDKAMEELAQKGRVFYDQTESVVWVVNAIRHSSLNENCKKSVRKDIEFCSAHNLAHSLLFYYKSIGYSWVTEGFVIPEDPTYRVQGIGYRDRVQGTGKGEEREKGELPEQLDTPEFRAAWDLFRQHRKEKRAPLTPTSEALALKKLLDVDVGIAIAMVTRSIEKGWTGIFELKEVGNGRTSNSASGTRRAPGGTGGAAPGSGKYARVTQQHQGPGGDGKQGAARIADASPPSVPAKGP